MRLLEALRAAARWFAGRHPVAVLLRWVVAAALLYVCAIVGLVAAVGFYNSSGLFEGCLSLWLGCQARHDPAVAALAAVVMVVAATVAMLTVVTAWSPKAARRLLRRMFRRS